MINPAVFLKEPLHYGKYIEIFPPSVKDVCTNPQFGQFKSILTLSQYDVEFELKKQLKDDQKCPTPLEFLLSNCYHNESFYLFTTLSFLYFTHRKIELDYENKQIIFLIEEEGKGTITEAITEDTFLVFQNLIREACGEKPIAPPEPEDPNEDPRIRRIKRKARERDAIKNRNGSKSKDGISLDSCLAAICCMGIGLTPLNIGEMSYANVALIMKVYQDKEKYDLDIRSLLAGADSKKIKPKYWIRNSV